MTSTVANSANLMAYLSFFITNIDKTNLIEVHNDLHIVPGG